MLEIIPFMLSLSKHVPLFFSSLLEPIESIKISLPLSLQREENSYEVTHV